MAADAKIVITADDAQVRDAMARVQSAVTGGMEKVQGSMAGVQAAIGRVNSALNATIGLVVGGGLASMGRQVVSVMSDFEQLEIRLTSVMGSASKSQQAFDWIKKFAQETPFEVGQVTESFMFLRNMGLDPMDGTMKAIADQAAKTGGGFQTLQRITLALGQAWTKGKLQGEEAMQLLEAGVPVWEMLSSVLGKSAAEVQKLSEKGRLGRDVIKALIDEIGRTADGSAGAQMQSLNGQMSNLADNVKGSLDELRTAGGLDPLKEALTDVNQTLGQLQQDGSIKEWAGQIATLFGLVSDAVRAVGGVIGAVFEIVRDAWNGLTGNVARSADEQISVMDVLCVAVEGVRVFFVGLETGIRLAMETVRAIVAFSVSQMISAFVWLSGSVQLAFELIRSPIYIAIEAISAFAAVAAKALQMDFDGAKAAWREGLAGVEAEVKASAGRIIKIADDTKAKLEAAKAPPTRFGEIAQDGNDKLFRRGKYAKEDAASPAAPSVTRPGGGVGSVGLLGGDGDQKSKMSDYSAQLQALKQRYQLEHNLQQMSSADEIRFWEEKKRLAAGNIKDLAAIEAKIQEVRLTEMQRGRQMEEARVAERRTAALEGVNQAEAAAQLQLAQGKMTQNEMLAAEREFEAQRYQINRQAAEEKLALYQNDPAKYAQIKAELAQIDAQYAVKRTQQQAKQTQQDMKYWNSLESGMSNMFESGANKMLTGQLKLKDALRQVWGQMGLLFVQNLVVKPLSEWVAGQMKMLAMEAAVGAKKLATKLGFLGAETAATTAAKTTETTASVAAAGTQVTADGVAAGAGAAKSVAGIPIIGPGLALGAMAATIAAVFALKGKLKSASGGYDIPAGLNPLTQLHQEEMVLPAQYANVIRDMAGASGGGGSGGQAGNSVTYNDYSGKLSRDQIRQNAKIIAEELSRVTKRGYSPA